MTEYFEGAAPYRQFVDDEKPARAGKAALDYLNDRLVNVGDQQYRKDHKGTPFYVLGYSAFACHDYTSASLYFDAAAEADLDHHKGNLDTPALRFIRVLQTPNENTLAGAIIANIEAQFETLINEYQRRAGHQSLTLADLRTHFFEEVLKRGPSHRRTLLTAFISFVAEWPYRARQMQLIPDGTREPFFVHLYRGCLLFESLLKSAPSAPPLKTLGKSLKHFKSQLGVREPVDISANQFEDVVAELSANMDVDKAILNCGKTRNTLGHNLVWTTANLDSQSYDGLVKNVGVSCIHAIATLYL